MKTTELRKGNYLYFINEGPECVVLDGISSYDDIIESHNEHERVAERGIEDFKPIPLDKEWLLKFNFSYDSHAFKIIFNGLRFVLFQINASNNYNDNKNEFSVTVYQHGNGIEIARIKHVHQLQNLYFALTQQELGDL